MSKIGVMGGAKQMRVMRVYVSTGLLCMGIGTSWAQATGNGGAATGAEQTPGAVQSMGPGQASTASGQQVRTGGMTPGVPGVERRTDRETSTALTVTVEGRSRTLTVKELEAMPQRTVTVQNGHTNAAETYTGVAVSDLLGLAGDAEAVRARVLRSYLRATGTDFYFVLYSGAELMGAMHTGDVIVALRRNGQGLGDAGALMLVSSEDKMPARWVRNLTSVTLTGVD